MDKIILANGTELEVSDLISIGEKLKITFKNKTIDELEQLMTKENLTQIKFTNSKDEVFGNYANLEYASVTKYVEDKSIVIELKETVSA